MVEILNGESDITPDGKVFLDQYYGFAELAELLQEKIVMNEGYSIDSWLKELKPMEISRFIEESRGNITPNQPLSNDLMPPVV